MHRCHLFSFNSHVTDLGVTALSRSCNFRIRALCHIRKSLTDDMAQSVGVALVSSGLEYTNSLLHGTSQSNIHKLQRIQNHLTKLVTQNYHISSLATIHSLHWLPVKCHNEFKISTLTYKLLHSHTPTYLVASTLHKNNSSQSETFDRPTRTCSTNRLHQPSLAHVPFTWLPQPSGTKSLSPFANIHH